MERTVDSCRRRLRGGRGSELDVRQISVTFPAGRWRYPASAAALILMLRVSCIRNFLFFNILLMEPAAAVHFATPRQPPGRNPDAVVRRGRRRRGPSGSNTLFSGAFPDISRRGRGMTGGLLYRWIRTRALVIVHRTTTGVTREENRNCSP